MFKFLIGKKKNSTLKFVPNLKKTEYENWLEFLEQGGKTEEWQQLLKENNWKFKSDPLERYDQYKKEVGPVSTKYYKLLESIEKDWSILYNMKDYTGEFAKRVETNCIVNLEEYEKMRMIDKKYNEKTPNNVPALKRLAMLYEKQGRYEEAIAVCKKAWSYGMDERARMIRMIKKVGREPNANEIQIINK